MSRRTFVGMTCVLVAASTVVRVQAQSRVRRIGWLSIDAPLPPARNDALWAFMRERGWIEGRSVTVEYRFAHGKTEMLRPYAEELVGLGIELIVTVGTEATLAAKAATRTIPIVFYSAGDPVRAGLVASLARPGGNVTGLSQIAEGMDAKRLALVREMLPNVQRVGDLVNPTNVFFRVTRDTYEEAYRSVGLQPIFVEVVDASELGAAVDEVARQGAQALVVREDGLFSANRPLVLRTAFSHRLPTFAGGSRYLEDGALLAYWAEESEHDRRLAVLIDKILRGAKPADLPVEQPTQFTLAINLKSAKALGISIPQPLLLRADQVIQ